MPAARNKDMAAEDLLREGERLDDLERSGLKIIQDPARFCFGMDAVLLSGWAKVRSGETVLDIGTGTGIIPILLTAKTEGRHFTGLEIQKEMADMAARSVAYNHLEDRVEIRQGDIREAAQMWEPQHFQVITCNPPYMKVSHGIKNPDSALAIARHELTCTLEDAVREGARLLVSKGRYYMVHRPHRLMDILTVMRAYRLEPKRIRFVHPFADAEANMVLIEAVKDGGIYLHAEAPLVIYEEPGRYTRELLDLYGY